MYGQRFNYFGARGPGGTLGLSVALGSLGCFLCRVRSEACAGTSAVLPYHQKTVGGQAGGVVGSAHASQCQSLVTHTLAARAHHAAPWPKERLGQAFTFRLTHTQSQNKLESLIACFAEWGIGNGYSTKHESSTITTTPEQSSTTCCRECQGSSSSKRSGNTFTRAI